MMCTSYPAAELLVGMRLVGGFRINDVDHRGRLSLITTKYGTVALSKQSQIWVMSK